MEIGAGSRVKIGIGETSLVGYALWVRLPLVNVRIECSPTHECRLVNAGDLIEISVPKHSISCNG